MTAKQFEDVVSTAASTLDDWNNFLGDLLAIAGPGDSKFDLSAPIPNVSPPMTIDELSQKLSGTLALLLEFAEIESTLLIPDQILIDLLARVGRLRPTVESLTTQVNSIDTENKVTSIDTAAMVATTTAGEQINIAPGLVELQALVQGLLVSAQQIRSVAGLSGRGGLALELSHMQTARAAQRTALGDFRRLSKAMEAQRKVLEALVIAAKESAANVANAQTSANAELVRVAEAKERAATLIAAARESEDAAKAVKDTVDAYNKTFAEFQQALDARNAAFEKGQSDLKRFIEGSEARRDTLLGDQTARYNAVSGSIQAKETEIEEILKRSRAVLGEATVSGLSDSFAKEMKEASRQIWWMQFLFFVSIVLLVIAAAIVLDAFPWVHVAKAAAPATGDALSVAVYLLANFLRTLTFLLAPLLLLIYAAQRYVELFKMKTHYTYKYTVAASLPGFKLEAPKYAEEITAAAFQELLFNPGDSLGKTDDAEKTGTTFLQRILEPIVKRAMEKMGEGPR